MTLSKAMANSVSAVRCAREGMSVGLNGKVSQNDVQELTELYTTDNEQFYSSCVNKMKQTIDSMEKNVGPDSIFKMMELSGLMADRITKQYLVKAPKLETENKYERTRSGISVYNNNGTKIKTIPWQEVTKGELNGKLG
jgi:hypothetical protein